ncbi:MAG: Flp pilus assembly protein CpaB [Armatimonadetes bacterium]|nr:Flp pilus assembly protein CpaB [Armatimonadota bacterium]
MGQALRSKLLIAAVVMGLITALLVYLYMSRQISAASAEVPIIVAQRDIPIGSILNGSMLGVLNVPKKALPPGVATSPDMVVGKVVMRQIYAGEPVLLSAVALTNRLSQLIPIAMRAVTVALDPVSGVAGFIQPGDHVDVIATFNVDGGTLSKVVLQDVELLAAGGQAIADQGPPQQAGAIKGPQVYPTATLAVTPQQAEELVLAESKGKLRLALRRPDDRSRISSKGITGRDVVGIVPPDVPKEQPPPAQAGAPTPQPSAAQQPVAAAPVQKQPKPAAPRTSQIEIVRGTQIEQVTVPK